MAIRTNHSSSLSKDGIALTQADSKLNTLALWSIFENCAPHKQKSSTHAPSAIRKDAIRPIQHEIRQQLTLLPMGGGGIFIPHQKSISCHSENN